MLKSASSLAALLIVTAQLALSAGCACSNRSHRATLSPDASAAIQKAYPSAKVTKVKAETKNGFKTYAVELANGTAEVEADVMENGTILETETPVSANDLPQAVTAAIAKAAPGVEVKDVKKQETLADAKTGKLAEPKLAYVIEVAKDGKEGELEVAADGTLLGALKWEGKERGEREEDKGERGKGDDEDDD